MLTTGLPSEDSPPTHPLEVTDVHSRRLLRFEKAEHVFLGAQVSDRLQGLLHNNRFNLLLHPR